MKISRMAAAVIRLWGFALIVLVHACSGGEEGLGQPVARVADRSLYEQTVRFENGTGRAEYIEAWIESELLRLHAGKSGEAPGFAHATAADRILAELAGRVLLDSLIRASIHITNGSLFSYYSENGEEFRADRPGAHVLHIGFFSPAKASEAKRNLADVSGGRDTVWASYNADEKLVYESELHPELGRAIFAGRDGQLLGPIESEFGYHLIYILKMYKSGDQFPFDIVREKIYGQLLRQLWPGAEIAILDSLREETDIEIITQ